MDITQRMGEDDLAFPTSVVVDETSTNSDVHCTVACFHQKKNRLMQIGKESTRK